MLKLEMVLFFNPHLKAKGYEHVEIMHRWGYFGPTKDWLVRYPTIKWMGVMAYNHMPHTLAGLGGKCNQAQQTIDSCVVDQIRVVSYGKMRTYTGRSCRSKKSERLVMF